MPRSKSQRAQAARRAPASAAGTVAVAIAASREVAARFLKISANAFSICAFRLSSLSISSSWRVSRRSKSSRGVVMVRIVRKGKLGQTPLSQESIGTAPAAPRSASPRNARVAGPARQALPCGAVNRPPAPSTQPAIPVSRPPLPLLPAKTARSMPDRPTCAGGVDDPAQSSLEWLIPRNVCPNSPSVAENVRIGREALLAGVVNSNRF
jgi:hypothetical protein